MKKGDIVYFRENHKHKYVTGDFEFKLDLEYLVYSIQTNNSTCTIQEVSSGKCHFIHGDGFRKLITKREYNLMKLEI